MNFERSKPINYIHFEDGACQLNSTRIILERDIPLIVNGQVWMNMLCTPFQLDQLAIGFLFNEGLIQSKDEVVNLHVCESGDYIEVKTTHPLSEPRHWKRTTGCSGGLTAINPPELPVPQLKEIHLSPEEIYTLIRKFFIAQKEHQETGGVHTAALSDGVELLTLTEDIGRHNTLDKLAGYCLLNQVPLPQPVILTTGRISSEMLQKSARMGTSVIISRTSTNDYTIGLAERWGITLIGYARTNSFNIYTHPESITGAETAKCEEGFS